ncbi:hypothetical protein TWF970_009611 [Orbilia oligospora]|uniref:Uncharacterized protein n=1 Tax=Orbilia oligospora TaxID=2813651 RepID=A0A7C8RJK1_ORBOL|nr:hypothetical protein TWF970_009611 [Orbilia oligospora]
MRLELLYLTTLSSIAEAQWSYRLLYTPIPRDVILWNTKPISHYPKPCAGLCRRFIGRKARNPGPASVDHKKRALTGIAIHQPANNDNFKTPVMAKYVGFWSSYHCRALPRYVIHFRQELNTMQEISFQQFDMFIPGFNASDYNIWGWGEIPHGDIVFGSIPPGGVAFREGGARSWTGNYLVVDNMVAVGPRSVVHGELRANPELRPSHWHINMGEENYERLTRPKDGVTPPILGEIVSYRYYGPIAPENVRTYEGVDDILNIEHLNRDIQGEKRIGKMEEEPPLPPAYHMDEQKRAILRAYVQIHGAESALFALQQMIDEYRFQHYMGMLTPELQEAARRDGIMQLRVAERADRLAENHIQRQVIQQSEESREAFFIKSRADLQREKDTGRDMILFLISEIQELDGVEIGPDEEAQSGDNQIERDTGNLGQGIERQETGRIPYAGVENNNQELQNEGECELEAELPTAAQLLPESDSLPLLDFGPVSNSEIQRLSEKLFNQKNRFIVNLDTDTQNEPAEMEELTIEYSKPKDEAKEHIIEQEFDEVQADRFIDPELRNVINSEVENLVRSEYGGLLRSEGLENHQGGLLDLEESSSLKIIDDEESPNQRPESEEPFDRIPLNQAAEGYENQDLGELERQRPPIDMAVESGNNIASLQQNHISEQSSNSEQQIPLNQLDVDSDDEPRFASTFGRDRYRNRAPQLEDSPRTRQHITTYGRMSFGDWLATRPIQVAAGLVDLGIIPNLAQENDDQDGDVPNEIIRGPNK